MTERPGPGGLEPPGSPYGPPPPVGGQPPPTLPPLGYPGGPAVTGAAGGSAKGFLRSLFDFSFSSFVATKVVKVLYVLVVLIAAIYTLLLLAVGFRAGTGVGLLFLVVVCPLFFIVFVAVYRVLLEVMVVIFRIADDLAEIRRRGGSGMLGS